MRLSPVPSSALPTITSRNGKRARLLPLPELSVPPDESNPIPAASVPTPSRNQLPLRSTNCYEFADLDISPSDFVSIMISKKMSYTISKLADPTKPKSYNKYSHIHWTTTDSKDFNLQSLIRQAMSIFNHVINNHDQTATVEAQLRHTMESLPPLPTNPTYAKVLKKQRDAKQQAVTLFRNEIMDQCRTNDIVRKKAWPGDNLGKWIRVYDKLGTKTILI